MATTHSIPLEDASLEFGTLFSILRIPVRKEAGISEPIKLRSIRFRGNNDEGITGSITYNPANNTFNHASGDKASSLMFGDELTLTEEVQYIHLGILPLEYTDGVTFTFLTNAGVTVKTANFPQTLTLAGNTIYTIPEVVLNTDDRVSIPDANFRAWLLDTSGEGPYIEVDTDTDNISLLPNAFELRRMPLANADIRSMKGVEYFTGLLQLICNNNESLTSLDVSKNVDLQQLYCNNTDIAELDLSKNINLHYINCGKTNITELDLSKNTKLDELHCYSTKIDKLDLSENTELLGLYCYKTDITELDLSVCPKFSYLNFCNETTPTDLNISGCNELYSIGYNESLYIMAPNSKIVEIPGNVLIRNLKAADLDHSAIQKISIANNEYIESIDVSNSVLTVLKLSDNPNLKSVNITGATIGEIINTGNHQDIEIITQQP